MSILAKIKAFFGFRKKVEVPKPLTLIEQFESKYKALPEIDKQKFLESAWLASEQESLKFLSQNLGHALDALEYFLAATEHFELEVGIYKLKTRSLPGVVDKEYEKVLGRLPVLAECFAKPSSEVLNVLDNYIQKFEEHLLLAEADGTYHIRTSENGKWILFPFLDEKVFRTIRKSDALKTLNSLFVNTSALGLLELDTHVPWIPISFVEVLEKSKNGRMSLLSNPVNAKYYGYIYN